MRDLARGKNTVDDTGHAQYPVTRPKSRDFVRLSSESTPENPRMLGGTLQEAQAYLDGLPHADRQAYNDYNAYYRRLKRAKNANSIDIAKNEYPRGYEIYKEYHKTKRRIQSREAEQSTNQPGESSTTNRSTQNSSQETWEEWFDRSGYPR